MNFPFRATKLCR